MAITMILFVLLIHWIGDFVLQSDKQSKRKATSVKYLLQHTLVYSLVWFSFISVVFTDLRVATAFTIITLIFHTITDYFTSKQVKKLFKKGDIHNMFVVIGLDQLLHYVQLLITFKLIVL